MLNIIHTTINIGLENPVKILHVTDVHLTYYNDSDPPRQRELLDWRKKTFHKEGNCPLETPEEYLCEAIALAEEMGALLVVTGDVIDIHTNGNVEKFRGIMKGHDMMFTPGGHEHQRVCVRTMEEGRAYADSMREKLKMEFPEFDIDFDSRVIGGVNIITANNSLDYYNADTVARFENELKRGLPIVVFSHDPINDELMGLTESYHPNVELTAREYQISNTMRDKLINDPLVIATVAGHWHRSDECVINGKTHYVTDGLFKGICRLIEII